MFNATYDFERTKLQYLFGFWYRPFLQTLWGLLKHKCVPLRMFLHNVFEYAEEDDDVQATRDFATLMDHGYINKYISSKSNYISVH